MPNYTLRIFSEGEKVRQFSGTRMQVELEFSKEIMSGRWLACHMEWGTKRRIRRSVII